MSHEQTSIGGQDKIVSLLEFETGTIAIGSWSGIAIARSCQQNSEWSMRQPRNEDGPY